MHGDPLLNPAVPPSSVGGMRRLLACVEFKMNNKSKKKGGINMVLVKFAVGSDMW
jgi:hypothetical protein